MKLLEWFKRSKVKFHKWHFKRIYGDKLPQVFDVFCLGNIDNSKEDLVVPGNIFIQGFLDVNNVSVDGDIFVDGYVDCANLTVGGNFISSSPTAVRCFTAKVNKLFDCYDVLSRTSRIYATDYICRIYEEKA